MASLRARAGIVAVVLTVILSAPPTLAITFKLTPSYYAKCFAEAIPPDTPVYVDYAVAGQQGLMDVNFWVKNPENKIVLNKQMIDHDKHSFMTGPGQADQVYKFCFLHELYKKTFDEGSTRMVTMNLRIGTLAKQLINPKVPLAKKSDMDQLNNAINTVESLVQEIVNDIDVVRTREGLMEAEASRVTWRVTSFSVAACLVIVFMGVYDFYYTKQFLKKKKFI